MKERFLQNLDLLKKNHINVDEHDACGVGFVVSMNGKPKREVILNGIYALKLFGTEELSMQMAKLEMELVCILNLVQNFSKIKLNQPGMN